MSGETLRDRLAAIYHDPTCPCPTRDEALNFADSMVAVVAEWLRAEAAKIRQDITNDASRPDRGDKSARRDWSAQVAALTALADALTTQPTDTTET